MPPNADRPEPLDSRLQLKLPSFEGPLDLLLHLCQKHELDIVTLPIAFVTERYLEYVRWMEKLDLDVAAEYLVMAATLAHIKSKSLLPPDPSAIDEEASPEEEIDPRQELIRRLLEYQKYKAAGEALGARGVAGRDVFLRGMEAPEVAGPAPLAGVGLFKLLDAFQVVLKRAKADLAFQITAEGITIQDRMTQLATSLRQKKRCTFDELFDDARTVYDIVVTFLALLEMAKRRLASVYQSDPSAAIHIEYRVLEAEDEAAPSGAPSGSAVPAGAERTAAPERPSIAPSGPASIEDTATAADADTNAAFEETLAASDGEGQDAAPSRGDDR